MDRIEGRAVFIERQRGKRVREVNILKRRWMILVRFSAPPNSLIDKTILGWLDSG